jgi:RNA polymerase sigma factor (sigma-70 family)
MSALLEAPGREVAPDSEVSDHKLVAAVRRGDERAFEALYERYHRRIHAYVFGMVKDHQRAEDVTQEVFVSALRRMRATERPIAFKPWVYEIAKNACIDQFRRSKRAEEISYDADDGLAPSDYGRLVSHEPAPDVALAAKQQLDQLCGAFGGLSDAHHEILVLRELEGLSYRDIGERMGMSRPAVESTLFRARRRLTEEYDELASGERCLRIQSIIVNAGSGRLGARDTRKLARHVAHCQPCRREAVAAGVDAALVARRPVRRRIAEKVASLLPFPFLLRGRRGDSSGDGWLSQLPTVSDQAAAGTAKLAAAAVVLVAGLGAGMETHVGTADALRGGNADRSSKPAAARSESATPARAPRVTPGTGRDAGDDPGAARDGARLEGTARKGETRGAPASARRQASSESPAAGGGSGDRSSGGGLTSGGDGAVPPAVRDQAPDTTPPAPPSPPRNTPKLEVTIPPVEVPSTGTTVPGSQIDAGAVVGGTIGAGGTLDQVEETVGGTVDSAAGAVGQVTDGLPIQP